jgi:error-prone DNA polymerase
MLAALEDTIEQLRVHEDVAIDLAKLPSDDPATYAMIRRADTIGTFQIESRAQMATLPRMKPERFYDLVVEVAIIRPGPITGKLVHPYLERRAGRQPVTYPHPSLEPILARTLGVPLFQEQLLRIAMTAAGFSGGEAEELRRAMGFKRSVERMERIEERLVDGMRARGLGDDAQQEILRGITSFALYGFPESHAASFALIAYASAWLKCHHPAAFLAGLLNAQPMGFYSAATLVKDAQRHGVEVRPIDVARSAWPNVLERDGGHPRGAGASPAVRLGLRRVAGLRESTAQRLVAERARRPFASAADLAARVRPAREELAALAELGALAGIDAAASTRRSALWQVSALAREPLLAAARPPDEPSPLPEMSEVEQTLADYRGSGVTTGAHLMAHLREGLDARGVLSAAALRALPDGRFVRTAGHVIVRQRPGTAKGFCFLTLEDETGTSNAVLTPDAFARFRDALHAASLLELAGPLQNVEGVIHVRVRELRPLAPGGGLPRSHDYR